jgi:hypothetical protein
MLVHNNSFQDTVSLLQEPHTAWQAGMTWALSQLLCCSGYWCGLTSVDIKPGVDLACCSSLEAAEDCSNSSCIQYQKHYTY